MSSRKKKQNAELATGSARNLDGRRLRTINEAKNLATYLATKPEMDRKEKEERRRRWEQVIELAEHKEADMRAGKGVDGRRKGLSDEWLEQKDEVGEGVKNAVKMAMLATNGGNDSGPTEKDQAGNSTSGDSNHASEDDSDDDMMELDDEGMSRLKAEAENGDSDAIWVLKNKLKIPAQHLPRGKPLKPRRRFAGFDDDDEDDLSSDGDIHDQEAVKGKAKLVSVA